MRGVQAGGGRRGAACSKWPWPAATNAAARRPRSAPPPWTREESTRRTDARLRRHAVAAPRSLIPLPLTKGQ